MFITNIQYLIVLNTLTFVFHLSRTLSLSFFGSSLLLHSGLVCFNLFRDACSYFCFIYNYNTLIWGWIPRLNFDLKEFRELWFWLGRRFWLVLRPSPSSIMSFSRSLANNLRSFSSKRSSLASTRSASQQQQLILTQIALISSSWQFSTLLLSSHSLPYLLPSPLGGSISLISGISTQFNFTIMDHVISFSGYCSSFLEFFFFFISSSSSSFIILHCCWSKAISNRGFNWETHFVGSCWFGRSIKGE